MLIDEDMNEYERMAREHDNRQPFIQDELVEGIKSLIFSDNQYEGG